MARAWLSRVATRGTTMSDGSVAETASFLPGPVRISKEVQAAFARPAYSHRSARFVDDMERCRGQLCQLVNAQSVAVLLGSGTLANDVIAGQLGTGGTRGLVLSNGEFGDRLVDHAARMCLEIDTIRAPWGHPLPYARVSETLAQGRHRWLWACHCETSTGLLNDLNELKDACAAHDVELIADCISSIGAVPVDLEGVKLASCVSGKALASYAGLAMVFYRGAVRQDAKLPRYLDLAAYAQTPGVPYTTSSNLVAALRIALDQLMADRDNGRGGVTTQLHTRRAVASMIGARLADLGCTLWSADGMASPAVVSFLPPIGVDSVALGQALDDRGVLLSYRSSYLIEHNTLQVCLMGLHDEAYVVKLLDAFEYALGQVAEANANGAKPGAAGVR